MTAPEEPAWFDEEGPPAIRELFAKAFEAMDENSFTGTVYQGTVSSQVNVSLPSPPAKPNYWIRWEYDTGEWELFDRLDWGKALRRFLLSISLTVVLYSIAVSLLEMAIWSSPSD